MELNREQIIKALECCSSEKYICEQCPIDKKIKDDCECGKVVARNALALIKELNSENKLLNVELGNANSEILRLIEGKKELTEENERLRKRNITLEQKFVILEREEVPVLTLAIREHDDPVGKPGKCGLHKQYQADTVRKMQEKVTLHFGTYTDKDEVKVREVFRLIDQIAKEIIEGGNHQWR